MYLVSFSRALIELEKILPKELYDELEVRKLHVQSLDRQIKETELVNLCPTITPPEMADLINKIGSSEFNPKYRINSLMLERFEEIKKETIDIWVRILLGLVYELSSSFVQSQNIQLPKDKQPTDQQSVDIEKPTSTPPYTTVPVTESHFVTEDIPTENVQIREDIEADVNKDLEIKGVKDIRFWIRHKVAKPSVHKS